MDILLKIFLILMHWKERKNARKKDLLESTENWDKVSFGDDVEDNEGEDVLDESVECDKSKTDINKEANIPEESELNPQECKEVVSNLELMEKKKVIDDGLKQKITCLC